MKRIHSILTTGLALVLPTIFGATAIAETLLPTADTSSTLTLTKANPPVVTKAVLTAGAGKSGSLVVSKTRHAFIQFDAADKLTAEGLTAADIMSAKLTIYFPSAAKAGPIDLRLVTEPWTEKPTGSEPEPSVASGAIDSVPAARVIAKQFFTFDVTSAVTGWLTSGTDYGFALESPDGLANVTIGAKEGPGSGYPATLEIETSAAAPSPYSSLFEAGNGNLGIGTTTPSHTLDISVGGDDVRITGNTSFGGNGLILENTDVSTQQWFLGAGDNAGTSGSSKGFYIQNFNTGAVDLAISTNGDISANGKITTNGSVGIGTTSPAHKLDISVGGDDVRITGNTSFGGNGLILENTDASTQQWFLGAGDNAGTSGSSKGFYIQNFNTGAVDLAISTDGHVGIGTNSFTQARLVVIGSASSGALGPYGFLTNTGAGSSPNGPSASVSIFASDDVHATTFRAFSDARIKIIQGHSDSTHDLQTLRGIEITDYRYKDTITKGDRPQKKVVAQQVEKVFPQAVNQSTGVVPDIYHKAGIEDGWVNLATDLEVGDRVRLIAEKTEGIYPVLEVKDGAFRTVFQPEGAEVFVYGREVNDFRTVDYEAISMLNVSATQELARQFETKDSEIKELRAANAALAQKVSALEARDEAREARLTRLENEFAPSVALARAPAK